ncbi:sulfatase family protein [Rhodopirellula sp. SWK7]|nr:sulfatase family protein [Rhodopirellula sp. SWK7]
MNRSLTQTTEHRILFAQWSFWCVWMLLFALLHPLGGPLDDAALASALDRTSEVGQTSAWDWIGFRGHIAMQCVSLQIPSLIVALAWNVFRPRIGRPFGSRFFGSRRLASQLLRSSTLGSWLFAVVPAWFAFDVLAFSWSGSHLASEEFASLVFDHLPNLTPFFSWGMLAPVLAIAIALMGGAAATQGIRFLAKTMTSRRGATPTPPNTSQRPKYGTILIVLGLLASVTVVTATASRHAWQDNIHNHPTRHPWASFSRASREFAPLPPFEYDTASLAAATQSRVQQMRMNVASRASDSDAFEHQPDILIVICESLRPEMLAPDVMPHAYAAAEKGLFLTQHYSGGNATSLGIFSIVNGLEAVWFYKSEVRFAPAMNRLFHQSGYELGFFAGHDDWGTFQMDAFLSPDQFDRFETEPMDWLAADRRAIATTASFLNPNTTPQRSPRLAILFLYSTHAPFAVAPQQAIDQPAASADYPIPFPRSWRPSVWNRYRNAARTLDAEFAGLIRPDRITVITGDHGESFLDDGTVGHGTRLSMAQTRVAAFIAGPGIPSRKMTQRTMHADILPTLLSASGLQMSMPEQLDGANLLSATTRQLQSRLFSISNLVGRDMVIVPPRKSPRLTASPAASGATFGTRVRFSLIDQTVVPLGPLSEKGVMPIRDEPSTESRGDAVLKRWLENLAR